MNAPPAIKSSESIAKLSTALIEFHRRVPKIPKSCRNPFLKSRYADLSTILDIVQPVLNECELVIQQHPTSDFGLTTILSHSSGEWMSSEYRMMPSESVIEKAKDGAPAVKGITPQSIGSVITYQRRYAIGAILSLNIDDDVDGHQSGVGEDNGSGSNGKPAAPVKSVAELMAEAAAKVEAQPAPAPVAEVSKVVEVAATTIDQPEDGDSTAEQRARIQELYSILKISPEKQMEILARRGLTVLRSLTAEQAAAIITALEGKLPAATALVDNDSGQSHIGVHSAPTNGPCTDQQIVEIKQALIEWEQSQEGVTEKFISAMNSAGFAKMKDLSFEQARTELANIEAKDIANFFAASLVPAVT